MAYVFSTVNETSQQYLISERRYNYTTPKSFLELISLYSKLLSNKTSETYQKIKRLENGLVRLAICADQVDSLKHVLAEQEIQLNVKNEAADKLIVVVSSENEIVQKEKRTGNICVPSFSKIFLQLVFPVARTKKPLKRVTQVIFHSFKTTATG